MAKAKTDKRVSEPPPAPATPPEPPPAPATPPEPPPAPATPPEPPPALQQRLDIISTLGHPPDNTPIPQGVDLFSEDELTGVPLSAAPGSPVSSNPEDLLPGETDADRKIRLGRKATGRPKGSKNTATERADFKDVVAATQNFRGMAEMTFGLATGMLTGIFGPEWQPKTPEEKEGVVKPLEDYFRLKQIPDLPPGWIVAIAVMAYSAPRLNHPNTQVKIKNTVNRLRGKKVVASTVSMPDAIPV